MTVVHATCVDIDGAADLLREPFATGKSDLALRVIDDGVKLVAYDQMQCAAVRGELTASATAQLSDKMEDPGLGIFDLGDSQLLPGAHVALVADLGPSNYIARLPHHKARPVGSTTRMFFPLPLPAFESSEPAKIRMALRFWSAAGRQARALNNA